MLPRQLLQHQECHLDYRDMPSGLVQKKKIVFLQDTISLCVVLTIMELAL